MVNINKGGYNDQNYVKKTKWLFALIKPTLQKR